MLMSLSSFKSGVVFDLAVPSVGIFLHDILASLAAAGRQLRQQGRRWFMRGEKTRGPDRRARR
jgi:hypothetical protein